MAENFARYHLAAIVSVWLTAILTLWTALDAGFKAVLVSIFSHHWIAKAVIITAAFIIIAFLYPIKSNKSFGWWAKKTTWSVVLSSLTIFLFYIWHFAGA